MGIPYKPLDKLINVVYNGIIMDNEIIVIDPYQKYREAAVNRTQDIKEVVDEERERRRSELQVWAQKQRIITDAPPTQKQLKKIYNRLKKGCTIVKAINKVCSVTTWNKWKQEYPEVAAIEEQAHAQYIESLQELKMRLASKSGTKMGEIARDKLQIDELDKQIDRIDRLTENRNKKSSAFGGSMIPIQINVGYGNKKTS